MGPVSQQTLELMAILAPIGMFLERSAAERRAAGPEISDFVSGDPHEMPIDGYVEALRRWSAPRRTDWYAYKRSEPEAQAVVAASLRERLDLPFEPEDVMMTNGAVAGLAVSLRVIAGPGDEVIIISPPYFLYEAFVRAAGAAVVRVRVDPATFDLDVDAIEAAITERTRAVIVNSPHNPTGKIYPPRTLERLAGLLAEASGRHGRPVYLLSDEAYRRIVFDDRTFTSPAAFYPNTLVIYTYGKQHLAPGERVGYVALHPEIPGPDRELLRVAFLASQAVMGWAWPGALLQHALGDLEPLSVDVKHLQWRRDRLVEGLRGLGYELHAPEGTFYLLPRSPIEDDAAFAELLARERVFVIPGSLMEMPGHFRISLTANDEMIERSWPGFAAAMETARPT